MFIKSIAISLLPAFLCLLPALRGGNPPLAAGAFPAQEAVQETPQDTDTHLGKAYEAMRNERYDDAVREFRAALAIDATLAMRARFPLAIALFEKHDFPASRAELLQVRKEAGEQAGVSYYLGRIDLEEQHYQSAVENLSKAAANPPFPDTAFYLGLACLKTGDERNAEKWLKEAARVNPGDSRAVYQLATLYRKQGRNEEANQAYARTKEEKASSGKLTQLKVACGEELARGLTPKARELCEQLNDPNDAAKLTALGTLYGQHGLPGEALPPLRRAAELSPSSPQMQYNLAYAYFQLGQFSEARGPLEQATRRWPDLFPLNALYGNVLWKLGDTPGAYRALSAAHKLNPDDKPTEELLYKSTVILADQAEAKAATADAIRYWKEAAKLRPAQPEPHSRLAALYTKTGRAQLARQEQQEADRLIGASGP
jgi:tetratricopeptide (TPR) repeat protein